MDESQEGRRLKRQMKGRHIERREMWRREALVQRKGPKGEWIKARRSTTRGRQSEYKAPNREGNWQLWKEKGSNSVLHLERRERQEVKQFILSYYWRQWKNRKAAMHHGSSEAYNWRWREAGQEAGSNWVAPQKIISDWEGITFLKVSSFWSVKR